MFAWLKRLFDRSNDPVHSCDLYRDKSAGSCAHVDGPLCDFPKCSMLADYRLQQGGEILRGELQKARHDLMVRETAKDERIADVEAAGHRLALELECLLMDTKDLPVVSRWWDSAQVALAMWKMLDQQPHISPLGMD